MLTNSAESAFQKDSALHHHLIYETALQVAKPVRDGSFRDKLVREIAARAVLEWASRSATRTLQTADLQTLVGEIEDITRAQRHFAFLHLCQKDDEFLTTASHQFVNDWARNNFRNKSVPNDPYRDHVETISGLVYGKLELGRRVLRDYLKRETDVPAPREAAYAEDFVAYLRKAIKHEFLDIIRLKKYRAPFLSGKVPHAGGNDRDRAEGVDPAACDSSSDPSFRLLEECTRAEMQRILALVRVYAESRRESKTRTSILAWLECIERDRLKHGDLAFLARRLNVTTEVLNQNVFQFRDKIRYLFRKELDLIFLSRNI